MAEKTCRYCGAVLPPARRRPGCCAEGPCRERWARERLAMTRAAQRAWKDRKRRPRPIPQPDPDLPPLGVVVADDDGERVQCHVCGRFYRSVGIHARLAHGLSADAYRERYSISDATGLISPALRERMRALDPLSRLPGLPPPAGPRTRPPRRLSTRLAASRTKRAKAAAARQGPILDTAPPACGGSRPS